MLNQAREHVVGAIAVLLCLFTLVEVNYPQLAPHSQLAVFAMMGMALTFLLFPAHKTWKDSRLARGLDLVLLLLACVCCVYVIVQTEPFFQSWWLEGRSLGNRAGAETRLDYLIGALGVLIVLEVTRRTVGLPLTLLASAFLLYAYLRRLFSKLAIPSPRVFARPHRRSDLSAQPGRFRHRAQRDVLLRVSLRRLRRFARDHRCDPVHHRIDAEIVSRKPGRRIESGRPRKRSHGIAFRLRRRQRRHHGYVHDSVDEKLGISSSYRGRHHGGGKLRWSARSAGHGSRRLHDARDHRSSGDLSPDRQGRHPPRHALLPGALPHRSLLLSARRSHGGAGRDDGRVPVPVRGRRFLRRARVVDRIPHPALFRVSCGFARHRCCARTERRFTLEPESDSSKDFKR